MDLKRSEAGQRGLLETATSDYRDGLIAERLRLQREWAATADAPRRLATGVRAIGAAACLAGAVGVIASKRRS